MRFANHAEGRHANCTVKVIFSKGHWRIGLYSKEKRRISKGEELFFNYSFEKVFDWIRAYREKFKELK